MGAPAKALKRKPLGGTTCPPAGQVIWRPRFDAKLSSAIDSLLELEELGIPVARRFRHRLEEYVPG